MPLVVVVTKVWTVHGTQIALRNPSVHIMQRQYAVNTTTYIYAVLTVWSKVVKNVAHIYYLTAKRAGAEGGRGNCRI